MRNIRGRRATVVAVLVALLVPVAVLGAVLVSLDEPAQRAGAVRAAVVNNDRPVKLNGQLAPLGRQLAAKLIGGELPGNYHWEIATEQSAAQGMRDGGYVATVVIPANFSRAATSFAREPGNAQRARIEVRTSDRAGQVDTAVADQLTAGAARLLGRDLSAGYLENVYLGFTTLHDQLGKASKGVGALAGGARKLAGGTGKLSGAAGKLAGGNRQLATGLGTLRDGTGKLAGGAAQLSAGLDTLNARTKRLPDQVGKLSTVADLQAKGVHQLSDGLGRYSAGMDQLADACPPTALTYCAEVRKLAGAAQQLDAGSGKLTLAGDGVATGLRTLHAGLPKLTGGIDRLATGARTLASGVDRLHGGAATSAAGATKLADGSGQLAAGTGTLGTGAKKLSDGTAKLDDGLGQAGKKIPSYTKAERKALSTVVADPVRAAAATGTGTGSTATYAVLALWLGALGTFLVLRPRPARLLETTRSTLRLLLRALRVPMLIGVAQGVLVAVLLGVTGALPAGGWAGCAGLAVLVALGCTALNHGLAAAWPRVGRFAALLVGLLLLVTGFGVTTPAALTELTGLLPVGSAADGLRALLDGSGSAGPAVAAMLLWGLAGLVVGYAALERRRTVRAPALLAPPRRLLVHSG